MAIILLGFLLALFYILDQKRFIYWLMLFFVFFDMVDGFYKDNNIFAAVRYVLPFVLITLYILANNVVEKSDIALLFFVIFLSGLLIWNPGDILISTKTTLSIVISVSMLMIGRHLGYRGNFSKSFQPYNRVLLIAIPLYILYANIFNIGESYSSSFTTGFLVTSRMYLVPIVVFLAIHYVLSNNQSGTFLKVIDTGFIGINIIMLMLTTRRTSLMMLFGAVVIYIYLNKEIIIKMGFILFFLVSAMILSYPLYENILDAQLRQRERIRQLDTYQNEGRYLETFFIFNHHKRTQNPKELFLGVKLFDTVDFGERNFGYTRTIHSDLNMIFYSTGLIGLIVFFTFFWYYLILGNGRIAPENRKLFYPLLVMFMIVIVPGRFIGTFTFAPLLMLLLSGIKYSSNVDISRKVNRVKRRKLVRDS